MCCCNGILFLHCAEMLRQLYPKFNVVRVCDMEQCVCSADRQSLLSLQVMTLYMDID